MFSQLCSEFSDTLVPVNHPYYDRVKRVANRLLRANKHMPQIYTKHWTITVLNDPNSVNAFVLPVSLGKKPSQYVINDFPIHLFMFKNGNIFVFTGMLDMCATDEELGMVLGHEIAHCLLGHAVKSPRKELCILYFFNNQMGYLSIG